MMFINLIGFLFIFSLSGAFLTCFLILIKSKKSGKEVKNDDLIFRYETELDNERRARIWKQIEQRGLDITYLYWRNKRKHN